MFNFWWSAGVVDGLKPNPPPLSSQKNEMLLFGLCSTSDDWLGWSMDLNPICHPSPAKKKKMKCLFSWITFTFWWSVGLVNGLESHLPSLSSQKKIKCLFLDYLHQQIHLETMDDHLYRFLVIRNIRSKHVPPAKIHFSGVHCNWGKK